MAGCSLVTLRAQYQGRCVQSNGKLWPCNFKVRMPTRNYIEKTHFPCRFNSPRMHKTSNIFLPFDFDGRAGRMRSSVKCCFLQSLINSESIVPANLVSLSDEALLIISIIFAYMAGVVPPGQTFPHARNHGANQLPTAASSTDSGRCTGFDSSDSWSEVRVKLLESVEANVQGASLDGREVEFKNDSKNYPLSMLAIDGGPRLRLLLITSQLLEMEVSKVSESCEFVNGSTWLQVSTRLIYGLVQPAFIKWIEGEQTLEYGKINEMISRKTKEDGRILKRFNNLGKSELYLDVLFFLRFGSVRSDGHFDAKFLTEHGTKILEDLIIFLADGISSIYLELMSVDGDMSTDICGSSLILCSLSTRALQKLRNEVAINWWLHQYFESVVSMYEDRFELYILCTVQHKKPVDDRAEKISWQRLAFRKPAMASMLNYVHISPFSLLVRRTKELRALTGWRYYFSLFLELSDIAMPFVRAVVTKGSAAISYFWVSMIGRSLGLIFSGIRQSLGWR